MQNTSLILCVFSLITCTIINTMDPVIKIENSTEQKKNDALAKKSASSGRLKYKNLKTLKLSGSDSSSRATNSSNSGGSREPSPRTPSSSPRGIFSSKQKTKTDDEYLISAVRNGNANAIINFLDNPDNNPNLQCISTLNTLLHITVVSHYPDTIKLFLEDPRVNSRIRNKDGRIPIQCIHSDDIPKLKKIYVEIQKRKRLDEIVDSLILLDEEMTEKNISSETLMKKIYPWYQTLSQSLPHYNTLQFMYQMVSHRIRYNRATILMLIADQKKDPNQQDALGETPLHYAAYTGDVIKLKKLLKNPITNTLIKNWEGKTAQQILPATSPHSEEIRIPLFIRSTLDILINKEIAQFKTQHVTFELNNPIFIGMVQKIKENLLKVQTTQKEDDSDDRQLPNEAAVLPYYATDEFFLKAINKRTNNQEVLKATKLLENPIANISIKNSEDNTAQVIPATNLHSEEIHRSLSIQSTLDTLIDKEIAHLGTFTEHLTFELENPIFIGIVQKIKEELLRIQTTQKQDSSNDRQLSDEAAVLPGDEFFLEVINERIRNWPKDKQKNQAIKFLNDEDSLYL